MDKQPNKSMRFLWMMYSMMRKFVTTAYQFQVTKPKIYQDKPMGCMGF